MTVTATLPASGPIIDDDWSSHAHAWSAWWGTSHVDYRFCTSCGATQTVHGPPMTPGPIGLRP